jgi:macrophage erythroblast attacher
MENEFEDDLHFQSCIEIIRQGKRMEAIQYAKKNMKENANLKVAMACMIYKDPLTSPYENLFMDGVWQDLITSFKTAFYQVYGMSEHSSFLLYLQNGLIALKTPLSYEKSLFNINDPLCDPRIQLLAKDLPWALHEQSKIVCRITGKLIMDDNPPLVLPNGNVYSQKGLESITVNGAFVDPSTKEEFRMSQTRKIFIL